LVEQLIRNQQVIGSSPIAGSIVPPSNVRKCSRVSVHQRYQTTLVDQRQFFDELITEEWSSYINASWDYARRFEIAQLLRRIKPRRILDVGCGCGFHDAEMAQFPFVEHVTGIDYSAQSIHKANEAYPHPKVSRHVADFLADPIEPVHDLVVSFQVLEHLPEPDQYFQKAIAACVPGGSIAIVTPNWARLDNRVRRRKGMPPALLDPQHFREYTVNELRDIGRTHGLKMIDRFGHTFYSGAAPWMTPKNDRVRLQLGAWLLPLAHIIGVVFEVRERQV
jgi:2-polyprenyl-3-methyl-5-hydroxy-6-metoxy-1,4-benzoquinol methylase